MKRMRRVLLSVSVAVCLLVVGVPAMSGSILSGAVSFNTATHLYTYMYTVDNTSGPAPVNDFAVLINPFAANFTLTPVSSTTPVGWMFFTSVSGSSALPPLNEFGTFWEWGGGSVAVGSTLSGFSFTTPYGPQVGSANNYFVFSFSFNGGPIGNEGTVEFGHIVAPLVVPEPSGLILLGTGLLVGMNALRRKRHT